MRRSHPRRVAFLLAFFVAAAHPLMMVLSLSRIRR
jgi:hypothetical protein